MPRPLYRPLASSPPTRRHLRRVLKLGLAFALVSGLGLVSGLSSGLLSGRVSGLGPALSLPLGIAPALAARPTCDTVRPPGTCGLYSTGMSYPSTLSGTTPEGNTAGIASFHTTYACQTGSDGRVYILLDTQGSYDSATGDAESSVQGFYFDKADTSMGGHHHQTLVASLRTANHASGCVSGSVVTEIPIVRHGDTEPGNYNQFTYWPHTHVATSTGASDNYTGTVVGVGGAYVTVIESTCKMWTPYITLPDIDLSELPGAGSRGGTTTAYLSFNDCDEVNMADLSIRSSGASVINARQGILGNADTSGDGAKGIGLALEIDAFSAHDFDPVDLSGSRAVGLMGEAPKVPLRVSYYRYAEQASGGRVKGLLEVTATYK